MKSFLYTLIAVVALSLGGAFTSTAMAHGGGNGGGHHHGGNYNHGHQHHHHGGYGGGYGGYGSYRPVYPVYPQPYPYYRQNGIYIGGNNFGLRLGF